MKILKQWPRNPLGFWAVLLAVLMLSASCAEVMQRLALANCKFAFHSIEPVNLGLTSLDLRLSIRIENPNPVNVIFDKMGFEFTINERRLFQGTMGGRMEIASGASSILEHVISLSPIEAGITIISAVREGRAAYRLIGKAEFDTPLGPLVFPVDIVRGEIQPPYSLP